MFFISTARGPPSLTKGRLDGLAAKSMLWYSHILSSSQAVILTLAVGKEALHSCSVPIKGKEVLQYNPQIAQLMFEHWAFPDILSGKYLVSPENAEPSLRSITDSNNTNASRDRTARDFNIHCKSNRLTRTRLIVRTQVNGFLCFSSLIISDY
jgi:hypothetical protein